MGKLNKWLTVLVLGILSGCLGCDIYISGFPFYEDCGYDDDTVVIIEDDHYYDEYYYDDYYYDDYYYDDCYYDYYGYYKVKSAQHP